MRRIGWAGYRLGPVKAPSRRAGFRHGLSARIRRTAGSLLQLSRMIRCNIDQRGRTVRLVLGAFLETTGLLLGVLWYFDWAPAWVGWPALAVWVSGMFVVFEALVGWCAVRAMGFRTPF